MRSIGVAIATYNRSVLTLAAFQAVQRDPRVACVAISDDYSDPDTYHALESLLRPLPCTLLAQNDRRLGSWLNKRKAVELCAVDWVALIDSDNAIDKIYLDALYALSMWRADTLYLPVRGVPALDYEKYAGLVFDKNNVYEYLQEPLFQTVLNTGNFFVNRVNHLLVSGGAAEESYASDGIYFVYRWMAAGLKVMITPGLSYEHLVHDGHWMQTAAQSLTFSYELIRRMRANIWEAPCVA